ncbi:MAG: hypothetical protein ACP5U1_13535, partial [Desulfomonilaceae bacterium]
MIGSLFFSIVGAILLSLAFPPWHLDFLAWSAFVPLLVAIEREKLLSKAAICGFSFGFVFFLIDLRWIIQTMVTYGKFSTPMATIVFFLMVATLSILPAIFSGISFFLVKRGFDIFWVAP